MLWLIGNRVLLPGISMLVADVHRAGLAAINQALADQTPVHVQGELAATLAVPDGKAVSVLEWMRTPVTRLSGTGMIEALDRTAYVVGLGTGAVDVSAVAPVKLAELARFGTAKAFRIGQLRDARKAATLLATVRHLEAVSLADALLLFDLLMGTVLLSRAAREGNQERLRTLPRLRSAAVKLAAAWAVVRDTPHVQAGRTARRRPSPRRSW